MLELRTTLPKSSKMNGFVRPFAYVTRPANRISAGHMRLARTRGGADVVAERRGFERVGRATALALWRDVTLPPARLQSSCGDAHVNFVGFAVAFWRGKTKRVLAVQFVNDGSEAGTKVLSVPNLGVAAAALFGDTRKTRIRQVSGHHGPQAVRSDGRRPVSCAAAHADGVDHDLLITRAVDHLDLADEALAEDHAAVVAVAQHEDDAAIVACVAKRFNGLIESAPQRRRCVRRDRGRQRPAQLIRIPRERRADRDVVSKGAEASGVARL